MFNVSILNNQEVDPMVVKKKAKTRAKTTTRKKAKAPVKRKVKRVVKPAAKKAVKTAKKKTKAKTKRKGGGGLSKLTYSLSEELQAIVGAKSLTRPEIVKKLWAYIKSRKCQDAVNKRMIVPDAKLAAVIGKKPVDMMKLAGLISKHIK